MKRIAIFTSKNPSVDEVCATYALAEYLTYRKHLKVDRNKNVIQTAKAYVIRDNTQQWSVEADAITQMASGKATQIGDAFVAPDIKIAIGVCNACEFGEKGAELWGQWMEVESYIIRPGKSIFQMNKKSLLQKKTPTRKSCTEMVYDYINQETRGDFIDMHISALLYLGLFWSTKHFTENLSTDTFQMVHQLVTRGSQMNDLAKLHTILDKPKKNSFQASWYGSLLTTAKENDHALICHKSIENVKAGMEVMDKLVKEFDKDIIVFYGVLEEDDREDAMASSTVALYCYLRKGVFQDERSIRMDARTLLVHIPQLAYLSVKSSESNPRVACATLTDSMKQIAQVLEEQILIPTERSMALLKASLF